MVLKKARQNITVLINRLFGSQIIAQRGTFRSFRPSGRLKAVLVPPTDAHLETKEIIMKNICMNTTKITDANKVILPT